MKILEIKHLEDCFDGSLEKEILFDNAITEAFIMHIGQMGKLQYFPHFPRPFFKINADGIVIKGIKDNNTARLTIFDKQKLEQLKTIINEYEPKEGEES